MIDQEKDGKNKSSAATRRRLLDAALKEFGEHGLAAVSTRRLAQKAEANQAAIPYHFGGKEGLYFAVVEDLVHSAQKTIGSKGKDIRECLQRGEMSMEEGEVLLRGLIGMIVNFLVGPDEASYRASIVIRELMHPSPAFDLLYEGYMKQVHTLVTKLVAVLVGDDPESQASILRAHALLGQIVFFGAGRELIRRRAGWKQLNQERLDEIKLTVTETFIASIRSMRGDNTKEKQN